MQELKIGEELMHDRKYDFQGYIDEAEVYRREQQQH